MELKNKKTVLIFADWYLPGYKAGGPIKSIYSIVSYLKDDFNFFIITSNTDLGELVPYENIVSDQFIKVDDSVSIFYASKGFLKRKNILHLIKSVNFDVLYLNSLFSFYFSLLPIFFHITASIKKPIVLAPRGMLGEGALKIKSKKKNIFISLFKLINIHKRVIWQATSEQEKKEINKVFGKNLNIAVVPNLQYSASSILHKPLFKTKGCVKLFFLSRISEKKNLLFALNILSNLKIDNTVVVFDIIGPIEDLLYWQKCKKIIDKMPNTIKVTYHSAIHNSEVPQFIYGYHFLFLPTFNENYGHAIVESLVNGKPIIISDQTPWRNLKENGSGWDISLDDEKGFSQALLNCIDMGQEEYNEMSKNSIDYAKKYCVSMASVELTKQLFINAC
jgi:glycosyltransferase involved in cell wall biosynthesis